MLPRTASPILLADAPWVILVCGASLLGALACQPARRPVERGPLDPDLARGIGLQASGEVYGARSAFLASLARAPSSRAVAFLASIVAAGSGREVWRVAGVRQIGAYGLCAVVYPPEALVPGACELRALRDGGYPTEMERFEVAIADR